jgi:hypothetical protein
MELNEFRAKVYEMLEKHGSKTIDGTLYYPEPAIIELLEWFHEQAYEISPEKIEGMICDTLDRAFDKLGDMFQSPLTGEKTGKKSSGTSPT